MKIYILHRKQVKQKKKTAKSKNRQSLIKNCLTCYTELLLSYTALKDLNLSKYSNQEISACFGMVQPFSKTRQLDKSILAK